MSKISGLVLVALFFAMQSDANAWPGRRGYSYAPKQYTMPSMSTTQSMPTIQSYTSSGGANNSTAQGVAEMMAARNSVGHFGGNSGYEGCGSGPTPEAAYRNCCFANSGMTTVDVGYAQGRNGQWFCCRRYR